MNRMITFFVLALTFLVGLGALPTENVQADGFADAWSLQDESSALERCSLQPVFTHHPETGVRVIVLHPSC